MNNKIIIFILLLILLIIFSYFTFKNKNLNVQEIEHFQSDNPLNNIKFNLRGVSFTGAWTNGAEHLYTVKLVKEPESDYRYIFYIYSNPYIKMILFDFSRGGRIKFVDSGYQFVGNDSGNDYKASVTGSCCQPPPGQWGAHLIRLPEEDKERRY